MAAAALVDQNFQAYARIQGMRHRDKEILLLAFAADIGKETMPAYEQMKLGLSELIGHPVQLQVMDDWKRNQMN
jgi:hypothetical protein